MAILVSTLVSEINASIKSFVREQNPSTATVGGMSVGALTFTVVDAKQVSKGLVEIDDEMIWVRSVDPQSSVVTIEPWGRGVEGSTAVSHSNSARVTSSPTYPRVRVRDAISNVVQEIFPDIFAVAEKLLTVNPAQVRYALNADTYHVLSVSYNPPGPSLSWIPVKHWRQNKTPSLVELEILSRVTPGVDRVRVLYSKTPPPQLVLTDDLESMGYPLAVRDLVTLGTCARLTGLMEASRVQTGSVESHARSETTPAGSATALSRYYYQLFRQRLEDERRNLQQRYPIASHFTR